MCVSASLYVSVSVCDVVVVVMVERIWTRAECLAKDKTKREPKEKLDGGADVGHYSGFSSDYSYLLEPRYVEKQDHEIQAKDTTQRAQTCPDG